MTKDKLNQVDLCFVVDTTGSMGSFIAEAQRQLVNTIALVSQNSNIDLQVGLVEYRDHPPQDKSFVTRIYPLTDNLLKIQKSINKLKAQGGGDTPEAVYQGLHDACHKLTWRYHSLRLIMLVGDAPPHGFGVWWEKMTGDRFRSSGDSWADGCPSGLDVQLVAADAENNNTTIYALCMRSDRATRESFSAIASLTGGQSYESRRATEAIAQITTTLEREFSNLVLDRQVLSAIENTSSLDTDAISRTINNTRASVAQSLMRLGKRNFLRHYTTLDCG